MQSTPPTNVDGLLEESFSKLRLSKFDYNPPEESSSFNPFLSTPTGNSAVKNNLFQNLNQSEKTDEDSGANNSTPAFKKPPKSISILSSMPESTYLQDRRSFSNAR